MRRVWCVHDKMGDTPLREDMSLREREAHAKAAVETACASTPSVVVEAAGVVETKDEGSATTKTAGGTGGAVYQGGFKVVGNARFLREKKVSLVVNTARNLGDFFPKFNRMVASAKAGGAEFLELGWLDDERQVVSADDLSRAVRAVHAARQKGGSVVVHCAQGRSRSGTVSVAYVATLLAMKGGDDGGGGKDNNDKGGRTRDRRSGGSGGSNKHR